MRVAPCSAKISSTGNKLATQSKCEGKRRLYGVLKTTSEWVDVRRATGDDKNRLRLEVNWGGVYREKTFTKRTKSIRTILPRLWHALGIMIASGKYYSFFGIKFFQIHLPWNSSFSSFFEGDPPPIKHFQQHFSKTGFYKTSSKFSVINFNAEAGTKVQKRAILDWKPTSAERMFEASRKAKRRPESECSSNNFMQNPNSKSKILNLKTKRPRLRPSNKEQTPKIQNPKHIQKTPNPKSNIRIKNQNPKSETLNPKCWI